MVMPKAISRCGMERRTPPPSPSWAPSTQPQPTALTAVRQNGLLQRREIFAVAGDRVRPVGLGSDGQGADFRRRDRTEGFPLPPAATVLP